MTHQTYKINLIKFIQSLYITEYFLITDMNDNTPNSREGTSHATESVSFEWKQMWQLIPYNLFENKINHTIKD